MIDDFDVMIMKIFNIYLLAQKFVYLSTLRKKFKGLDKKIFFLCCCLHSTKDAICLLFLKFFLLWRKRKVSRRKVNKR